MHPLAVAILTFVASGSSTAVAQVYLPPPPPLRMPDLIWNSQMMRQLGTNGYRAF